MSAPAHPFRYPARPHVRRHGPVYEGDWGPYLPWLEDEFSFRCIYCLKRQVWAPTDVWSVEHLVPRSEAPDRALDYTNLVLACQWCNNRKLAASVPDPAAVAYGNCLRVVEESGEVRSLNEDGEILIRVLKLNSRQHVSYRSERMRTLSLLYACSPADWKRLMGYPQLLPNLKRKQPYENTRKEGLEESWFEQRKRHSLPDFYE